MKKVGNSAEAGSRGQPLKPQVDARPLRPQKPTHGHHGKPPLFAHLVSEREPLCAIGRVRASCDTNAVADRFLQSMRVRLPGSGQWYSSVKPRAYCCGNTPSRRRDLKQSHSIPTRRKAIAIINRNHVLIRLLPSLQRIKFSEAIGAGSSTGG